MILAVAAIGIDSGGARFSGETGSGYYDIRERVDNGTTDGDGGVIGMWSGFKESAGSVGTLTATIASSVDNAVATIALKPPQMDCSLSIVSPSSGATGPGTEWVFDVTGDHAGVYVTQASANPEIIHDGDNFLGLYTSCSREAISGGYRYTVSRRSGWMSLPTFSAVAGGRG
jgi:hypothetical protein